MGCVQLVTPTVSTVRLSMAPALSVPPQPTFTLPVAGQFALLECLSRQLIVLARPANHRVPHVLLHPPIVPLALRCIMALITTISPISANHHVLRPII